MYDKDNLVMRYTIRMDWDDVPARGLENINDGYQENEWAIENKSNGDEHRPFPTLRTFTYADAKDRRGVGRLDASPTKTIRLSVLWEAPRYSHGREEHLSKKHCTLLGPVGECTHSFIKPLEVTPVGNAIA